MTLQFCIELSFENNPEIKKARVNFNAFKEKKEQSLANLITIGNFRFSRSKVDQERSDGGGFKINQNILWKVILFIESTSIQTKIVKRL